MPLDISAAEYLNDYQTVNGHAKVLQEWDVQLFLLALAPAAVAFVLVIHCLIQCNMNTAIT